MLKLREIMIENEVSIGKLAHYLGIRETNLSAKLLKRVDFSIKELNKIKEFFVKNEVLNNDFDIGEFLKEI